MSDLNKQIVILDDPLSSLDETRREATARLLLTLSLKVKQLNVFTHKKDFLYMLCDKIRPNKSLRVRFDRKKGSRFEPFDIEDERKGEYALMIEGMVRYREEDFGPTPATMQANLRKVFEVVLKTKYYHILAEDIRGNKGLGNLLETLFNTGKLDSTLKPQLFNLCNVATDRHHGGIIDTPWSGELTRDELIPLITEALNLLEKI